MSYCFLGLLRFLMVVGGLQAYFAEHRTDDQPGLPPTIQAVPAPPVQQRVVMEPALGCPLIDRLTRNQGIPLQPQVAYPTPVAPCPVPRCPVPACTGAMPAPVAVRPVTLPTTPTVAACTLPMPREVVEPASVYLVKVRHINHDKSSMEWPRQVVTPGKPSNIGIGHEMQGWMMTTLVQPSEKCEHVKVHLLLTQLTGEATPRIYKGVLDCKVGANSLTAMKESGGTHPLAISVCVEKHQPSVIARPVPIQPAFTPVGPGLVSAMPVINGRVFANPVPNCPAAGAGACPGVCPCPAIPTLGYAFVPAPMPKTVTLKIEDGVTKLAFRSADLKTAAAEMTLELPGGSVKLKAAKGHIVVQGQDFAGRATKLEMVGDCLKLIGEAQLTCDRIGPGAEVKAEALTVRMGRGGFAELVPVQPVMPPLMVPGVRIAVPATMPARPGSVCPPDCCPGGMCPKDCCPQTGECLPPLPGR
jgi:hypothetical protein